jgi:hypothetical protein
MRSLERCGDLARIFERFRERQGPGENLTFDQFEHQMIDVSGFLETVDGRDVGMVERGEDAGFATEARDPIGIVDEGRRQGLDRDVAAEPRVVRPVDFTHPPGAERRDELVRPEARAHEERHLRRRSRIDP